MQKLACKRNRLLLICLRKQHKLTLKAFSTYCFCISLVPGTFYDIKTTLLQGVSFWACWKSSLFSSPDEATAWAPAEQAVIGFWIVYTGCTTLVGMVQETVCVSVCVCLIAGFDRVFRCFDFVCRPVSGLVISCVYRWMHSLWSYAICLSMRVDLVIYNNTVALWPWATKCYVLF